MKGFLWMIAAGIIVVALVAGTVGFFIGQGSITGKATEKEPIKIGMIMPLSGNAADIGRSNKNVLDIAVNEVNSKGGIDGRAIDLIYEDSIGCDSKIAATAMQKLVNVDKVVAVYSACSNVAFASHPIAEEAGVVHFGCASASKIRELGDYMFRIVPSDEFAGKVGAKYAKNGFNASKVAILYCDSDWCVGIKDKFKDTFKLLGGQILIEEQIKMGATDARTELTKIKNTNPELIYFAGYPQETLTVFKQAREIGLNVTFLGGDAWFDQTIPKEAGNAGENKFFTTPAVQYSEEFEKKIGGDVAICVPESYDTIHILANTIKKVGVDSEAIKNELYKLRNYRGESGIISLDEKGDLVDAVFDIKTFDNGTIVDYEKYVKAD